MGFYHDFHDSYQWHNILQVYDTEKIPSSKVITTEKRGLAKLFGLIRKKMAKVGFLSSFLGLTNLNIWLHLQIKINLKIIPKKS